MNAFGSLFPTPPAQSWVRWSYPTEQAFTIDVPMGWAMGGGTRNTFRTDPQFLLNSQSPDGLAQIFLGERSIPNFVEPQGFLITLTRPRKNRSKNRTQTLTHTSAAEGSPCDVQVCD